MSRCRAYIDMDETLLTGVEKPLGVLTPRVRPDAGWFLRMMATHCDLWLLTRASRAWAEKGLKAIGPTSSVFIGMISREDLLPIEEQVDVVSKSGLSEAEAVALLQEIPPIAPPGLVFDDFPVGSLMYWIKSLAVGIREDQWIRVEEFSEESPDRGGLHKAYLEFKRRFSRSPVVGLVR